MMETVSITTLSPAESIPSTKAIRAVVSLFWPYSSSTRQCALLLADPDFRLRNRKGQVRVRFAGASAEAVAKGKVGIGDEVLLELRGAAWAGETANVNTPGKSVDGELLYKGELGLRIVKKADNEETNVQINVNESTPPPEEPESDVDRTRRDVVGTPARPTANFLRSSLGGADVVPIYSSPAFVKRLKLSEESSSWDPFQQLQEEIEQQPRKKQRISFGDVRAWRLAERTPSPEPETPNARRERDLGEPEEQNRPLSPKVVDFQQHTGMPPPPLPKLQMPDSIMLDTASESGGPSTPKLQPVPSSALPLPSPFPMEAAQLQFGVADPNATFTPATIAGAATPNENSMSARLVDSVEQIEHVSGASSSPRQGREAISGAVEPPSDSVKGQQQTNGLSHSLASTAESTGSELEAAIHSAAGQPSPVRRTQTSILHPQIEGSDTEEDEEMYYEHLRRRFPTFDERGYIRVDHQEEGYYDDLSHVAESEADEVIEDMGVEPEDDEDSGEDGGDEDDVESHEFSLTEATVFPRSALGTEQSRNTPEAVESTETPQRADITGASSSSILTASAPSGKQHEAQSVPPLQPHESQPRSEKPQMTPGQVSDMPKTPARVHPRLSSLNCASATPLSRTSTPQSERDRIMKRTYSSLFGFKASPSPEKTNPIFRETSTPTHVSQSMSFTAKLVQAADKMDKEPRSTNEESSAKGEANNLPTEKHHTHHDEPVIPLEHHYPEVGSQSRDEDVHSQASLQRQATEATRDPRDSIRVADVQDGSLLAAVRADEAFREAVGEDATAAPGENEAVSPETRPIVADEVHSDHNAASKALMTSVQSLRDSDDIEMEDAPGDRTSSFVDDDPVPDGVAVNKELGAAIASRMVSGAAPSHTLPPSSVPRPSQVEVIDLGSSDDEETQAPATISTVPDTAPPADSEPGFRRTNEFSPYLDLRNLSPVPRDTSPNFPDTQRPSEHTTQDSRGSVLPSDMLNTTQTTLDRSEVATPVAQEIDTMIPDAMEEDGIWTQPGHQSFFAEQLHAAEVPGTQLPLTQNTTGTIGDAYHYFSFQSATSVATDNSDNMPATAQQSFADGRVGEDALTGESTPVRPSQIETVEILSSSPDMQERLHPRGSAEHVQNDRNPERDPMDVQSQETAIYRPVVDEFSREGQRQPDFLPSSQEQSEVSRIPETSQTKPAESEGTLSVNNGSRAAQSFGGTSQDMPKQSDDPQVLVERSFVDSRMEDARSYTHNRQQSLHSGLPISPAETQHGLDSQPFETQLPQHTLPPTPRLTQGDSSTQKKPDIIVEPTTEASNDDNGENDPKDLDTPRRTRRSKKTASDAIKISVRRSPRNSHVNDRASVVSVEESHDPQIDKESDAPAFSTRSRASTIEQPTLAPQKQTPTRKSPRKAHTDSQTAGESSRNYKGASTKLATPEPAINRSQAKDDMLSPVQETVVRRSPRNSKTSNATSREANEEPEDTIAVETKTDSSITRTSSRKAQASIENLKGEGDIAMAEDPPQKVKSRKSVPSRLTEVPAVISNWFSPRRSTGQEPEKPEKHAELDKNNVQETERKTTKKDLSTSLAYYTPLSQLERMVNPASQSGNIEVLAVVTDETKAPERSKSGPRDYFTVFHITDPFLAENTSIRVEVFRPWHATLPVAHVGDVVLLRSFAVKSRKRQPYLLSTDSSGWCVWRYTDDEGQKYPQTSPRGKGKAVAAGKRSTRQRTASFSGVREEVKGPPVELGDEERERAEELRTFWVDSVNSGTRAPDAAVAAKTRSERL